MASSIESRVPFLTPALVNFVYSLPEDYLLPSDGTTKSILRQAMRGIVPDVVLDRKDKLGFPTPERNWLLSMKSWVHKIVTSDAAEQIGAFDRSRLQQEWNAIVQGKHQLDSQVWRWINVILWTSRFSVAAE
jgi:asparagine synthase (glutamine-hydrolysing)